MPTSPSKRSRRQWKERPSGSGARVGASSQLIGNHELSIVEEQFAIRTALESNHRYVLKTSLPVERALPAM
eukprot:scaffold91074_cov32-Tisochrysis_lutea.AAC.2